MELYLNKFIYGISFIWVYLKIAIDIIIVAALLYWAYTFLAKTRAIQLLKGFIFILVMAVVSRAFDFQALNWLITNVTTYIVIAVIILFQPELRRLITQFGQRNWLTSSSSEEAFQLDELVNAVIAMAEEKIGSIVVIERNAGLRTFAESGVIINASITEELIRTVFFPNTALHDGALIIQEGKISAAACYLPLSDSKQLRKNHGARHRAALGIAEETDALCILTSEETGFVSIMVNGKIFPKIKFSDLKNMILFFMNPKTAYEEKYINK